MVHIVAEMYLGILSFLLRNQYALRDYFDRAFHIIAEAVVAYVLLSVFQHGVYAQTNIPAFALYYDCRRLRNV